MRHGGGDGAGHGRAVPDVECALHGRVVAPVRHRVALYEALTMQSIGLLGESLILQTLPTPTRSRARA